MVSIRLVQVPRIPFPGRDARRVVSVEGFETTAEPVDIPARREARRSRRSSSELHVNAHGVSTHETEASNPSVTSYDENGAVLF